MNDVPGLHGPVTDNALLGYSSDRYGTVDRNRMTASSRANSMSSQRMDDIGGGAYPPMGGAYSGMPNGRRMSQSPIEARPNGHGPGPGNSPGGYRGPPPGVRPPVPNGPNGYPHHVSDGYDG